MYVRLRPLAVLLAIALCGALLAACGSSGSSGSSEDAGTVLRQTFGESHQVKSGKLDLNLALDLKGLAQLQGPVTAKLGGPFQTTAPKQLPKFNFDLQFSASKQGLTAGAVSTGDKGFLKFQGRAYAVPDAIFTRFKQGYEQAQQQSKSKGDNTLKALGIDPTNWLKSPKNAGTEDVAGTSTIHVSADVDVAKFLADLNSILARAGSLGAGKVPTRLSPSERAQIQQAVKRARFDVWTGAKDKVMRKLALALSFDVPAAQQKNAGGLKSGTVEFTLQIADLNKGQTISAPANARPLSELTAALGGGLGGLGGSGGSSGSGSNGSGSSGSGSSGSGSSGSGSGKLEQYAKCLDDAGSDVAKAQKCASILG